jgi:hypothetical protein
MTKECLQYTKGLTVSLQKRANDIYQAYSEVKTVLAVLQDLRSKIDIKHKTWHDSAVALGQKVKAPEPQLSRRCLKTPTDTPEAYCRCNLSIPFLDELISHLENTFTYIQLQAIQGMKLVPSVLVDPSIPTCKNQELLDSMVVICHPHHHLR